MHQAERSKPSDGGSVEIGTALNLREVAGHGDHAVGDGRIEVGFCELLEIPEQHGEEVGRGERDAAADVVDVNDSRGAAIAGGDGEGEAGDIVDELRGAGGPKEEALDAGEGGVGGGRSRCVHAEEACVVGEGDGGGGLAFGLGVEEHVDAALPRRRRHQGVVADIEADHAHRRRRGIADSRFDRWEWGGTVVGFGLRGTVRRRVRSAHAGVGDEGRAGALLLVCRRQVGPLTAFCLLIGSVRSLSSPT